MDSQPSADDVQPLPRRAAAIADFEDDGRWAIIHEVRRRTDRTAFDAVGELARSADILERIVALDVLGQIGYPDEDEDADAIRAALAARLVDPDGDTAGEALLGLARRPPCTRATEQPRGMSEA